MSRRRGDGLQGPGRHVQGEHHGDVWPTQNYCVKQQSLCCCLSSEFEKILIPKVEFDAILQYFIKTFETLLFLQILYTFYFESV